MDPVKKILKKLKINNRRGGSQPPLQPASVSHASGPANFITHPPAPPNPIDQPLPTLPTGHAVLGGNDISIQEPPHILTVSGTHQDGNESGPPHPHLAPSRPSTSYQHCLVLDDSNRQTTPGVAQTSNALQSVDDFRPPHSHLAAVATLQGTTETVFWSLMAICKLTLTPQIVPPNHRIAGPRLAVLQRVWCQLRSMYL